MKITILCSVKSKVFLTNPSFILRIKCSFTKKNKNYSFYFTTAGTPTKHNFCKAVLIKRGSVKQISTPSVDVVLLVTPEIYTYSKIPGVHFIWEIKDTKQHNFFTK